MTVAGSTSVRHVFISFASTDVAFARLVLASLEQSGLQCWLAERDIEPADSYPAAITAAVKSSGAVLLLLTDAANQSPHVIREIELAFNARRPILPVRIGGATPSPDLQYFLSRSQWLDVGPSLDEAELAKVDTRIRQLLQGRTGFDEIEPRSFVRLALLAAVLIAGIAGAFVWKGRHQIEGPAPQSELTRDDKPTGDAEASRRDAGKPAGDVAKPTADPAKPAGVATTPTVDAVTIKLNPKDGQPYAWIPPGRFIMGCSAGDAACEKDEGPPHSVEIRRGFWLARTEVVQERFRRSADGKSGPGSSADKLPAVAVTWTAAKSYCQTIGGRLPTEAEWEYAARAGTSTRYYDSLKAIAWFSENSDDGPHAVGGKKPNAFGLYDMLGNVSEWVLDRYFNTYDDTSDPADVEQPLAANAFAVARGGSWVSDANGVRVSRRLEMFPDAEEPHIGFRCAVDRL
jgi:formylglycine-generating enzyme required for sulfatase activity